LFADEHPEDVPEGGSFLDGMNPNSLEVLTNCQLEPSLATATTDDRFQFERLGYFCVDSVDSQPGKPVFNRSVSLKDTWAKVQKRGA
ncbi:MAG: glutamine--tRNA ligase, partial [Planctomycetales bacterium]|nr:glutamine--tRNA ligase [Planctomycetales bacterium]